MYKHKTIHQLAFVLIAFILGLSDSAFAKTSVNGEWQYLIRRGDSTKSVGGRLPNPNCPLYVGYFKLDFRRMSKTSIGYDIKPGEKSFFREKGNGSMYAVGDMYETKGSYTDTESNNECATPPTGIQNEKAPIIITKISVDESNIEWMTDFSQGTYNANAIWQVKARYDGANSIKGILKAYGCEDSAKRRCALLNVANFEAKRVKSIEEASNKPLYKSNSPLSSILRRISPLLVNEGVFEKTMPFSDNGSILSELGIIESNSLNPQFVKPSLKAVFPAKAAPNHGLKVCQSKGGTGSDPCKVCKNIDCSTGETPSFTTDSGCCFGSSGSQICQCNSCTITAAGCSGCKSGTLGKTECI